jgi:branched-chain amino acid transport system permease protein
MAPEPREQSRMEKKSHGRSGQLLPAVQAVRGQRDQYLGRREHMNAGTAAIVLEQIMQAVSLGGMYSLIAIGYTIIYGVLKLINVAHGDFFMLAGFLAVWLVLYKNLPLSIGFPLAVVATILIALIVERVAYRPLMHHKLSAFTSTVALSMIIESSVVIFISPKARGFPRPAAFEGVFHVAGAAIPRVTPYIIVITILLFVLLYYLVNRTKMGIAMRALSKSTELVQLRGVKIGGILSFTFALSVGYASVAALLYGLRYPAFDPFSGVAVGLKAFVGAVIGGIGSIPGALVGGFALGVTEIAFVSLFPHMTAFRDIVAYALMIIFLSVRPGGLFNVKVVEEKV